MGSVRQSFICSCVWSSVWYIEPRIGSLQDCLIKNLTTITHKSLHLTHTSGFNVLALYLQIRTIFGTVVYPVPAEIPLPCTYLLPSHHHYTDKLNQLYTLTLISGKSLNETQIWDKSVCLRFSLNLFHVELPAGVSKELYYFSISNNWILYGFELPGYHFIGHQWR